MSKSDWNPARPGEKEPLKHIPTTSQATPHGNGAKGALGTLLACWQKARMDGQFQGGEEKTASTQCWQKQEERRRELRGKHGTKQPLNVKQ